MTDGPIRTVFLGSGAFGLPSLRALAADPLVHLAGVVTAPPRPVGRSQTVTPTPIGELAADLGIASVLTPSRLREPHAIAEVLGLGPDLLVLADYGQIVPPALLSAPHGALNLHPSLLPRHRGATPVPAAILAGDRETGVTLMRMDEGLDTGPVVATTIVPLRGDEIAPALEERLADEAAGLLTTTLPEWLGRRIAATPQGAAGATVTRPLRRDDGRLDPARPADLLERQVRAYQPWPGSYLETPFGRLVVWRSGVGGATPEVPGTLTASGIAAGDGRELRLVEIQPAGGRRMTWDAFARGRPALLGSSILE